MNAMQEVILDRLIGAPRQDFETHVGPVGLAVQALVDACIVERGADPHRFGYPLMLLRALEGACSMLRAVEDQRRVAIGVFTEVTPSSEPLSFPPRKHIQRALWCARRAHPLICRAECPLLEETAVQIEQYFQPTLAPFPLLRSSPSAFHSCIAGNQIVWDSREMGAVTIKYIGKTTIENVLAAARADQKHESPEEPSCRSAEYAGRLVGMREGVRGSIDFCLELARELGI